MSHINLVGWIKLYRQIVLSDVWTENEPYDSRSAFLYILSQAWFTPGYYRRRKIERGQFPTSEEELASIFGWGRGKVHRFLEALSEKGTISFEYLVDRRTTLITVTNFDTFQGEDRQVTDRQQTGDEQVTDRQQTGDEQQYKKNIIKNNKNEEGLSASAGTPSDDPPVGSDEWLEKHQDDDFDD